MKKVEPHSLLLSFDHVYANNHQNELPCNHWLLDKHLSGFKTSELEQDSADSAKLSLRNSWIIFML